MAFLFISYSHKDKDYVRNLANAIEKAGYEIWIDDRIDYGSKWPRVIQEQLDKCSVFVLVMSTRSFESDWVQNELARAMSKNKFVIPLLYEGDIWLAVQAIQYVDVKNGELPSSAFYKRLSQVMSPVENRSGSIQSLSRSIIPDKSPSSISDKSYSFNNDIENIEMVIKSRWNKGQGLVSVTYGEGVWFAVFKKGLLGTAYSYNANLEDFEATIERRWNEDRGLVSVTYGEGVWFAVFVSRA